MPPFAVIGCCSCNTSFAEGITSGSRAKALDYNMSLRLWCGRNLGSGSIVLPPISETTVEHHSPKLRELLPSLGRQCFYDGDILQQFLRQTVPLL